MKGALPANAWLDQEQLVIRLREEEIVEIDDFFTNVATKEMMHKIKQQKELGFLNNEEELLLEDDDIQQDEPDYVVGANVMSFNQYKKFWEENKEEVLANLKNNRFYAIEKSQEYYKKHYKELNEKIREED